MGAYVGNLEVMNTNLKKNVRTQDSVRTHDSIVIYKKSVQIFKMDSLRNDCKHHSKFPVYEMD